MVRAVPLPDKIWLAIPKHLSISWTPRIQGHALPTSSAKSSQSSRTTSPSSIN
jgi:hypothetical protein